MSIKCEFCDTLIDLSERRCPSCGATPSGVPQQPVSHQSPAPTQQAPPRAMLGVSPKSRLAAGLFGILLGGFGVHNFYLGFTGKGIAQVVLTVLSCVVPFLILVPWTWGLVEGILILSSNDPKDANGLSLVFS